jgi:hypothetical protein
VAEQTPEDLALAVTILKKFGDIDSLKMDAGMRARVREELLALELARLREQLADDAFFVLGAAEKLFREKKVVRCSLYHAGGCSLSSCEGLAPVETNGDTLETAYHNHEPIALKGGRPVALKGEGDV